MPDLIDYITARIHTLLGPEYTSDKAQAVRKEFKEITTISDFFGLLQDKYTSWFKHQPITQLVYENDINKNPYEDEDDALDDMYLYDESFDPDYVEKATSCWSRYQDNLHEYFKKCATVADPASYGITDAPPGEKILIVKVDRGDYDENDLYFLRKALPEEPERTGLKLYICQVLHN